MFIHGRNASWWWHSHCGRRRPRICVHSLEVANEDEQIVLSLLVAHNDRFVVCALFVLPLVFILHILHILHVLHILHIFHVLGVCTCSISAWMHRVFSDEMSPFVVILEWLLEDGDVVVLLFCGHRVYRLHALIVLAQSQNHIL